MTYLCYDIQHVILKYCRIKDITNMSLICDVYNELCNEILLFNTNDIIDTNLNILVKTDKYYVNEIPDNVFFTLTKFTQYMNNIIILNLSHNQITTIPETIGQLTQLQYLYLSDNQITTIPETIGQLTKLRYLNLEDTQITTILKTIVLTCRIKKK